MIRFRRQLVLIARNDTKVGMERRFETCGEGCDDEALETHDNAWFVHATKEAKVPLG